MHKAITKEELLELSNKQTTVKLVDIRSATEYLKSHIPEHN
jgi:rhodanese-related sulfurtransferase